MITLVDKKEFIYRYRDHFIILAKCQKEWFPHMRNSSLAPLVRYIANRARAELGYSFKTVANDIVYHLTNKFNDMDDLFDINNLDNPTARQSGKYNQAIRVTMEPGRIAFDKKYLDGLGINLEADGGLVFAINSKANPIILVFNLSEDVLSKGLCYFANASKEGYSPFISNRDVAMKFIVTTHHSDGTKIDKSKKFYDMRLEFMADHSDMKYFRLVR